MSALDKQIGGDHYQRSGIQPVEFIESNQLGFLEGSVVERVTRHGRPGGKGRQDIEKAIHELQLLLELRYGVYSGSKKAEGGEDVYAHYPPAAPSPSAYCHMCHSTPCECWAKSASKD